MVVLVVGTLAQRPLGLYEAQNRFFSSFYFWAGWLPFPGGYPVLALIFSGLVAKLAVAARWNRANLGVNVVHVGALALLFGGFLTAAFSTEGSMVIPEGATSAYVADHHKWELALIDTRPAGHDDVTAFDNGWLRAGATLKDARLPFEVEIVKFLRNAEPRQRPSPDPAAHGFAKIFELQEKPLDTEDARNRAGLMFRVKGLGGEADGMYALFDGMPIAQTLAVPGGKFTLELRHTRTPLPFSLELRRFERQVHPGTEVARAYSSELYLHDGGADQRVKIEMNKPLRYRGYTFYQASFSETGESRTTVLAVVKNLGAWFPYVSSLIMCLGLLIHLAMRVPRMLAPAEEEA